jgi:hypothetical protein
MAGATSARAWVAVRFPALRDRGRMRAFTVTLLALATLASSVSLAGSARPPAPTGGAAAASP